MIKKDQGHLSISHDGSARCLKKKECIPEFMFKKKKRPVISIMN